jgi:hypothetical protein
LEGIMPEANSDTDRKQNGAKAPTSREIQAAHEKMAASPEILAATLEGLEQIRRGDAVRITHKKS